MKEIRRSENPTGRYTLAFVGYGEAPGAGEIELTYNWDQQGRLRGRQRLRPPGRRRAGRGGGVRGGARGRRQGDA